MTEIIGYIGAVAMGLSLGLLGGGGSILTVPIFVYLFAIEPITATVYSLFVVGVTSVIGGVSHMRQGNVKWDTVMLFGMPSLISVFLTRAFVVHAIPENLFTINGMEISRATGLLVLFALLMLVASVSMIRKQKVENRLSIVGEWKNSVMLVLQGTLVGFVTGLVGAGGGFLIIPALVLLAGLSMKQAIGSTLVIIAINSTAGFIGDLSTEIQIDWHFLLPFSMIAIVGIILGSLVSKNISGEKLKPIFGWFVLVMGCYVLGAELLF